MEFPIAVDPKGTEDVTVSGPGFSFTLCAHGARELAQRLVTAADRQYCDGYRHGDESTMFGHTPVIDYTTERVKPLADLRASDVPRGIDPDDLVTG
jgi:hypothetical protein